MTLFTYWSEWGRWYRWPSYLYLWAVWRFFDTKCKNKSSCCPCVDGSNDYYWNGYFKSPRGCECGG